jgi:hypothetical protein
MCSMIERWSERPRGDDEDARGSGMDDDARSAT